MFKKTVSNFRDCFLKTKVILILSNKVEGDFNETAKIVRQNLL